VGATTLALWGVGAGIVVFSLRALRGFFSALFLSLSLSLPFFLFFSLFYSIFLFFVPCFFFLSFLLCEIVVVSAGISPRVWGLTACLGAEVFALFSVFKGHVPAPAGATKVRIPVLLTRYFCLFFFSSFLSSFSLLASLLSSLACSCLFSFDNRSSYDYYYYFLPQKGFVGCTGHLHGSGRISDQCGGSGDDDHFPRGVSHHDGLSLDDAGAFCACRFVSEKERQ